MIVAVAIGCVIVMVVVAAAVAVRKANRTPEPVRDWWPDFEREFHAYAQGSARQPRELRQELPERRPRRPDNR